MTPANAPAARGTDTRTRIPATTTEKWGSLAATTPAAHAPPRNSQTRRLHTDATHHRCTAIRNHSSAVAVISATTVQLRLC